MCCPWGTEEEVPQLFPEVWDLCLHRCSLWCNKLKAARKERIPLCCVRSPVPTPSPAVCLWFFISAVLSLSRTNHLLEPSCPGCGPRPPLYGC